MEDSHLNDAKLEKLLDKANIQKPLLVCAKGHQISLFCVSAQCKNPSFYCKICDMKTHLKCKKQDLDTIYISLQQNIENQKGIFKEIYAMGTKLIQLIKRNQEELSKKALLLGYQKHIQQIIENIFVKKQINKYRGEDMQSLRQALLKKMQINEIGQPQLMKSIQSTYQKMKKIIQQDFQQLFISDFSCDMKSQIVKKSEDINFIRKSLQSIQKLKSLKLLYRASQHAFSAAEFHKKCDNIEQTLTIVRTEFGKTIAGYNPIKFNQISSGQASDNSKKSFLLQVDLKQKMTLIKPQQAIYCNSSHGPLFGSGYPDIFITDKCNNTSSQTYFPLSYNYTQKPYPNNQETYNIFSGGQCFKVLNYEVYKVQFR